MEVRARRAFPPRSPSPTPPAGRKGYELSTSEPNIADNLSATVAAAVERHLAAARGTSAPVSTLSSSDPLHAAVLAAVERQLAARTAQPAAPACACRLSVASPAQGAAPAPAASPAVSPAVSIAPPAPPVHIVEFVCEDDVRAAIAKKQKIFIGPRTIVTPSARDLAAPAEVLVRAER